MRKVSGKIIKMGILASVMIICITIVGIIITGINHFKFGSQLASINQITNLSHLLVRQQAKLFSLMLVRNSKTEELTEALDLFSKEEFVIDAHLYSATGNLITQSHNAKPFQPELPSSNTPASTQQIVEPIYAQQELVGFLRVTFDTQYGQTTRNKVNELFHLLYGQLIILFLAGGLFVSCFYYFRRQKSHIARHITPSPLMEANQAKRFHSRRRAFRRK